MSVLAALLPNFALVLAAGCDVGAYYSGFDFDAPTVTLKNQLNRRIKSPHNSLPYADSTGTHTWDALIDLDRDPNNASQVWSIYSGQGVDANYRGATLGMWNPEHVFPQSWGVQMFKNVFF